MSQLLGALLWVSIVQDFMGGPCAVDVGIPSVGSPAGTSLRNAATDVGTRPRTNARTQKPRPLLITNPTTVLPPV